MPYYSNTSGDPVDNLTEVWEPSRVVFYSSANHATVQDAIDEAEALAASAVTDLQGVLVILPPGDYSAQDILIKKSLTVAALGRDQNVSLGTITIRPTSAILAPTRAGLVNVSAVELVVSNETATSSGVFHLAMLADQLILTGCRFGQIVANRVANIELRQCTVQGATNTFTYCESVTFLNCRVNNIDWRTDDSASHLPSVYSGGNPQFFNSRISEISLTKDGGSVTSYLAAYQTNFESIIMNGNCDIRVHGGAIESLTQNNTGNGFIEFQAFAPYKPATDADWDTVPKFVHTALDELAARIRALEP